MREYQLRNKNYKIRYNEFPGEGIPIIFIHWLGCAGSFDDVEIANRKEFLGHRKILIDFESKVSYNKGDMIYVEGELKIDDFKVIKNSEKK